MSGALRACPTCSASVSPQADACPHCGHVLRRTGGQKLGGCLWALFVLLVIVPLVLVGGTCAVGMFSGSQRSEAPAALPLRADRAPLAPGDEVALVDARLGHVALWPTIHDAREAGPADPTAYAPNGSRARLGHVEAGGAFVWVTLVGGPSSGEAGWTAEWNVRAEPQAP